MHSYFYKKWNRFHRLQFGIVPRLDSPARPGRMASSTKDFYLRYYVGHKGKFGHVFLEFEFRPDGKLRYANNSIYKNDTMTRKEAYVHQSVMEEVKPIIVDSEIMQQFDSLWPPPDRAGARNRHRRRAFMIHCLENGFAGGFQPVQGPGRTALILSVYSRTPCKQPWLLPSDCTPASDVSTVTISVREIFSAGIKVFHCSAKLTFYQVRASACAISFVLPLTCTTENVTSRSLLPKSAAERKRWQMHSLAPGP